jgi:hypothetical protein
VLLPGAGVESAESVILSVVIKRIVVLGLCMLGTSAGAAVLVASAAAELPEYATCQKLARPGRGKYENKTCTEVSASGEGHYELESGFGKVAAFTSKAGKSRLEVLEVPEAMECKATKLTGELAGSKYDQNILVTFTGCEAAGSKCTSSGARAGTIVSSRLKGELGYLARRGTQTPTIGVLLSQQEAGYAAEFSCEGVAARVHGPLIAEVGGDINTISAESTYNFRESGGTPQYTSFEGGTFLEDAWRWEFSRGFGFEPEGGQISGLALNAAVSSEALEIRA